MIKDSDIYYAGSLLPWALWIDENRHRVRAESIVEASRITAIQGEIYNTICETEMELRLRVARS